VEDVDAVMVMGMDVSVVIAVPLRPWGPMTVITAP